MAAAWDDRSAEGQISAQNLSVMNSHRKGLVPGLASGTKRRFGRLPGMGDGRRATAGGTTEPRNVGTAERRHRRTSEPRNDAPGGHPAASGASATPPKEPAQRERKRPWGSLSRPRQLPQVTTELRDSRGDAEMRSTRRTAARCSFAVPVCAVLRVSRETPHFWV